MSADGPKPTRRGFLRGLGGVTLGLPFLPSLLPRRAEAQGFVFPKRMLIFHTANGQPMRQWKPRGRERDFQLSPVLEPLAAFKDQLLIVSGLDMPAIGGENGHETGTLTVLTGAEPTAQWAGGISVDQLAASRIGGESGLRSLELGVQTTANKLGRMSFLGRDQPAPTENNPRRAFDRVFRGFERPQGEIVRGLDPRHASILDSVKSDFGRLERRLSRSDRQRLDAHLTQVRELERRLEVVSELGQGCEQPTAPRDVYAESNDLFPEVGRAHIDLLVAALACDVTRVGSLMWQEGSNNAQFTWLDPAVRTSHHEISHAIIHESPPNTLIEERQLTQINRWYAEQFRYLLERLSAIPEGDGTLLDNTVVFWSNELSDGFIHNREDMPFLLAGSCGGYFRTGRAVSYSHLPHNALLVSLLHAVGLTDVQKIGDFGASGPLPNLT